MAQIVILGSASAVPAVEHENTHMLVVEGDRNVLIDCGSNPVQHLNRAGIQFERLTDLILTHFHPDHVSGAPLLLMGMWLMGRKKSLEIYGLPHTMDRMEGMMTLFEWQRWPDFYPVNFNRVAGNELALVLETAGMRILASPVKHLIPTIGLRIEFKKSGKTVAYSCDTEPCDQVVRLAKDVDLLIHESTGNSIGHSSAVQAAEIACKANAKSLSLIHYPPDAHSDTLLKEARRIFSGNVIVATDFMDFQFE